MVQVGCFLLLLTTDLFQTSPSKIILNWLNNEFESNFNVACKHRHHRPKTWLKVLEDNYFWLKLRFVLYKISILFDCELSFVVLLCVCVCVCVSVCVCVCACVCVSVCCSPAHLSALRLEKLQPLISGWHSCSNVLEGLSLYFIEDLWQAIWHSWQGQRCQPAQADREMDTLGHRRIRLLHESIAGCVLRPFVAPLVQPGRNMWWPDRNQDKPISAFKPCLHYVFSTVSLWFCDLRFKADRYFTFTEQIWKQTWETNVRKLNKVRISTLCDSNCA